MDSLHSFEEELRNISKTLDECNDGSMTDLMEHARERRRATSSILAAVRTDTFTPPREARFAMPRSSFQEKATPPPAPVTTPATAKSGYDDSTPPRDTTVSDYHRSIRAQKAHLSPYYSSKNDLDQYVSKDRDVSFDLPPRREQPEESGVSPIRGYQTHTAKDKDDKTTTAYPYHQQRQQDGSLRYNEWKDLVDSMRDTIDRQEALIEKLQIENQNLTRELQLRRNEEYDSNIRSAGSRTPPQRRTYYDENSALPVNRRFSPGTKFVAELSQVMDLDPEVQVPLSLILDKQWERLSEIRQRHRWN